MTPHDLAAIRARDAGTVYPSPGHPWSVMLTDAQEDRRALLAEVDRLTADLEMARRVEREARSNQMTIAWSREKDRIRAAVEGLPGADEKWDWYGDDAPPDMVDRAAVLAAIDGGEG